MNIRLIAFDLDGTLLNSKKAVSPRTKAALERAAGKGALLVPATGRLHRDMPEDIRSLPSFRYVIAINGAEVYDFQEERLLHEANLDRSMKRAYTPTENPKKTLLEEKSGPQKLQLYFRDLEARKKALLEIPRLFPQCAVSSSLPINIEINATDVTKGHALAFLTKHLGLKTEETLAFGDGTNDITMIRQAGTGVAMGNADRVTASNDEDGLAKILEELGF